MAPLITRIYLKFTHLRLSALRKLIFGVHGVQESSFDLQKKVGRQVEFLNQSYREYYKANYAY